MRMKTRWKGSTLVWLFGSSQVLKFSIIPEYWSPCQANIVNCETDLENPTTNDLFGEVTSYFSLVLECHSLISTPNNLFKEVAFSAS